MTPVVYIRHSYFWLFSFVGIFATFGSPYFKAIGLVGYEMGTLSAIMPVATVIMPSLWGAFADRRGNTTTTLRLVLFGAAFSMLLFPFVTTFWPIFGMLTAMAFFRTASSSLLDSLTFTVLEKVGGDFGATRLWGSVGFVVAGLGVGLIADWASIHVVAWAMVIGLLMGAIVSLSLPVVMRERSDNVLADVKQTLQNREFVLFLASAFANRFAATAPLIFFPVVLKSAGHSNVFIAVFWATGVLAEVVYFRFAPMIAAKVGTDRVALAASVGIVIHFGLFLLVSSPVLILVIQMLHAVTFGAFYYTGVSYVAKTVPRRMRASGQALFAAAGFGIAGGLSSVCGGFIFDRYQGEGVLWFAVITGCIAVMMTIPVARRLRLSQ